MVTEEQAARFASSFAGAHDKDAVIGIVSSPSDSSSGAEDLPVNDVALLHHLEELAERIAIAVRYENITGEDSPGAGGLCRIRGEYVLIVHSRATVTEKIRLLTKALRQFDLSGIYLIPALRKLFEEPGNDTGEASDTDIGISPEKDP
jgi:hypothetical protein